MFSVYKITNLINGKMYIGFTKRTVDARWRSHCSSARNGSPFRFHSAIRKYGIDAWKIEVMAKFDSERDARKYEERRIAECDSMVTGYNAKPGGCGGRIVPETKIAQWKANLPIRNAGEGNGNFSGMTDGEIVSAFVSAHRSGVFDVSSGITDAIKKCSASHGVPKSYRKNFRFTEFGGGTTGLRVALDRAGLIFPTRPVAPDRRDKIANAIRGRLWFTHKETGQQKQFADDPGEEWTKGRKC